MESVPGLCERVNVEDGHVLVVLVRLTPEDGVRMGLGWGRGRVGVGWGGGRARKEQSTQRARKGQSTQRARKGQSTQGPLFFCLSRPLYSPVAFLVSASFAACTFARCHTPRFPMYVSLCITEIVLFLPVGRTFHCAVLRCTRDLSQLYIRVRCPREMAAGESKAKRCTFPCR